MIIRKYNYKLETGVVGTDDENIANILYKKLLDTVPSILALDAQAVGRV